MTAEGNGRGAAAGLFSPLTLRGVTLRNRFVMPAMQRGWLTDWAPDDRLVAHYGARAAGGVGLVIGESGAIDHPTSAGQKLAVYMDETTVHGWARCAEAAHAGGAAFFIQLWHEGATRPQQRGRHPDAPTLSPSGLVCAGRPNGRAATTAELAEIVAAYARSAALAEAAGADGVEIHGAHGFLIDEFLWAESNLRDDEYGGPDIGDRVRFAVEVVEAVRAAVRDDFVVGMRLSQFKEVDYGALVCHTPEELERMLRALTAAGVDVFHLSTRRFWMPEWESDRTFAAWCASVTDAAIITIGSVGIDGDPVSEFVATLVPDGADATATIVAELERRFARGDFDLVAVGRGQLGDPDWVRKVGEGAYAEIRAFDRVRDGQLLGWDSTHVDPLPVADEPARSAFPRPE